MIRITDFGSLFSSGLPGLQMVLKHPKILTPAVLVSRGMPVKKAPYSGEWRALYVNR